MIEKKISDWILMRPLNVRYNFELCLNVNVLKVGHVMHPSILNMEVAPLLHVMATTILGVKLRNLLVKAKK